MCQDVMKSAVRYVTPLTSVAAAAAIMRDEGIGFLPVCSEARTVLGTLTDRDIAIRVVAEELPAHQRVERFMTRNVVTCHPADELEHALELMSQEKVSRLVCVDEAGILQGIISLSDVAEVRDGALATATLRDISDREVRP